MEAAFIYLYLLCFEALRDCGCVFSVTMPASGTWIAKIVQAERKAKRSLGFDCIENGLRFGHSRTSSVMALDLRRFCRGAATAPIKPNTVPNLFEDG